MLQFDFQPFWERCLALKWMPVDRRTAETKNPEFILGFHGGEFLPRKKRLVCRRCPIARSSFFEKREVPVESRERIRFLRSPETEHAQSHLNHQQRRYSERHSRRAHAPTT